MPFFTQLDRRAEITGSRDPLGVQAIWSELGRRIVGNLTTVSNSVLDFMVLLLGHELIERTRQQDEADTAYRDRFLRWEQLAAYARVAVNEERGVRGSERVTARLRAAQESAIRVCHEWR
jgi:hypothetical protein